jgi:hypothetical protein
MLAAAVASIWLLGVVATFVDEPTSFVAGTAPPSISANPFSQLPSIVVLSTPTSFVLAGASILDVFGLDGCSMVSNLPMCDLVSTLYKTFGPLAGCS